MDPGIFRAYDIRGLVPDQIDANLAERLGLTLGDELKNAGETAAVIGADCRLTSPEIAAGLAEGLRNAGLDVIDLGKAPSPLVYFAARTLRQTDSAVVVTASHNPPQYNGFKIVCCGQPFGSEQLDALRQRLIEERKPATASRGELSRLDLLPTYLDDVASRIELKRPLKVVVDAGNSVSGLVAPDLYRRLGCEVTELFCEPDGLFPNHHPDPAKAENLSHLKQAVLDGGADLGLGFDGDGDRLGVVTDSGEIIESDRILLLFVEEILARRPGQTVIFDVKCSSLLPRHIASCGGRPLMSPSGHTLIKQAMARENACLGGEMSGHLFFADRWYGFDDAFYAGARLLEILADQSQPLSALLQRFPRGHNTPELEIPVPEAEKFALMDKVLSQCQFEGGRADYTDGLRVEFDDGWGLIRASNTSAKLTARFEGDDEQALERILERFRRQLLQLDERLQLPPWEVS